MKEKYYAVKVGRNKGIYKTWEECKREVDGFKNAVFKKFDNEKDAKNFISEDDFELEKNIEEDALIAYVDGSFDEKTESYSYGAVLIFGDEIKTFSKRFFDFENLKFRNVAGEIRASEFAIDYAIKNAYEKIIIHYDYTGIENWANGNWKTNNELTKNYKKYIDSAKNKIKIEFVKIEAHTGNKYNEMADTLAKEAK